jgi:hypothetical protein
VLEPKPAATSRSGLFANEDAETVIALGKRVYRFCKQSPEALRLDPSTVWRRIYDSTVDDAEGERLLTEFKDTSAWAMAVRTAKLMHEVYAAGGLEEEPA